jgi:hypothetical protein
MIYVTNHGEEELIDGYWGVRYEFLPEKTVEIPEEAALHIFGYGIEDKEPHLARLGWIKTRNEYKEGLKRLSKFEISLTAPAKKDHSLSPVVEKVPLPDDVRVRGKLRQVNT